VARVDKASVELEPSHDGHLDIRDQAGCFGEARRREKISRPVRCKKDDRTRLQEPEIAERL
jgi:hypothetical protein